MKKIFITGGTGFIGSYVVSECMNNGYFVTLLARDKHKVPYFLEQDNCCVIEADLDSKDIIEKHLPGHDALIHIALHWGDSCFEMLQNDTSSSVWLFEKAAQCNITNIIYTSSTAVNDWLYMTDEGKRSSINTIYTSDLPNVVTGYGATKAATEIYLHAISHIYGIRTNIIRPGYTFGNPLYSGSKTQPDGRFKELVSLALHGSDIVLEKNDGTQFIWAGDLAILYRKLVESGKNREIYYGLGNEFITWESIVAYIVKKTNSKSKTIITDTGRPDKPALFDVSKMKNDFSLEFPPHYNLEKHIDYYIQKLTS